MDAGLNFFDTADVVLERRERDGAGQGAGAPDKREHVLISTKGDVPVWRGAERCGVESGIT